MPGLCGESGGGPAAPPPGASPRRPEGNAVVWGEELGGRASNPALPTDHGRRGGMGSNPCTLHPGGK